MWEVIIKILAKATAKTIKQATKSKALGRAGQVAVKSKKIGLMKTFAMEVKKGLMKDTKTGKFVRAKKYCKDFIESADKLDTFMKIMFKNKREGRNLWNEYNNTIIKDWEKLFREARSVQFEYERRAVANFKSRKGISKVDFQAYKEIYKEVYKSGKYKDNPFIKQAFDEELMTKFDSSWIRFGIFIPYGRRKTRGIMCLQLYDTHSKRNPSLFYQWVNVPTKVWKIITEEPTGKNFWEKWYNKNRDNPKYLTAESIYYRKKKGNKK